MKLTIILFVILQSYIAICKKINVEELKCLVCKQSMNELTKAFNLLDPLKQVDVGGYRLDVEGNYKHKTVSQKKSELKLSELIETVCEKMDDYVRATDKVDGTLFLLKLMTDEGTMNPKMSEADIIQDDDLNKSLKYYCEELVEEYEDNIIKLYQNEDENVENEVCNNITHYCLQQNNKEEL